MENRNWGGDVREKRRAKSPLRLPENSFFSHVHQDERLSPILHYPADL